MLLLLRPQSASASPAAQAYGLGAAGAAAAAAARASSAAAAKQAAGRQLASLRARVGSKAVAQAVSHVTVVGGTAAVQPAKQPGKPSFKDALVAEGNKQIVKGAAAVADAYIPGSGVIVNAYGGEILSKGEDYLKSAGSKVVDTLKFW
jgi:hypothetical protein